jgi:hypothetical protein
VVVIQRTDGSESSAIPRVAPLREQSLFHSAQVERIRIPFIHYDRIASSGASIYDSVAAIRTVYCYQEFHRSSSLLSSSVGVLPLTGRRSQ